MLLLCLAVLALGAALQPARSLASSSQYTSFEAPRELFDPALRDATLDTIKGFGVDHLRQLVYWRDFAPAPDAKRMPAFDSADPAAYPAGTWDRLDALVAAAQARGMQLQLTLTGPVPRWATARTKDNLTDPSPKLFGRWVRAVALRYGDRVHMWSIWNEPNQPQFLLPQFTHRRPASPRLYRALYQAAVKAIRRTPGGADATVLFGETSPAGSSHVVAPLAFMRGALCLSSRWKKRKGCATLDTQGYAHHAYTKAVGPTYRSKDPDEVNIGSLDRLVRALDEAGRARAIPRRLGIYLTEFGIQSTPDKVAGVSLARQAEYIAISERIAYANPRVKAYSQYLMTDDPAHLDGPKAGRYSGFESGLEFHDGRRKPSYVGFQLPLAVSRYGQSDVFWGEVRPARGATDVTVERRIRAGAWKRLTALRTNPVGVFGLRTAHRKRAKYRLVWTRPDGSTLTGPPIRPY
jgi:hypothetical protein